MGNCGSDNQQVDILMLTANYAFIFEVKNIKGIIELKQNPSQLIRTLADGQVHAFKSPEPQLEEYIHQLQRFFLNQNINIPVYGAIIFPFTSSLIKQSSSKITVLQKNEIKPFLRKFTVSNSESISDRDFEQLKDYLLRIHRDFDPYPLIERYNIPQEDILKGVFCNECKRIGMRRISHYWFCPNCKSKNSNAHENTIYDYLTIVNNKITNAKCRDFLQIRSADQSYRMLSNMNLIKEGKKSGVKYMLREKN